MSEVTLTWLLALVLGISANLPFANSRYLALIPSKFQRKPFWVHLLEVLLLSAICLTVGLALEWNLGQLAPQGWQFGVAWLFSSLLLAFPGFVWRFLLVRR